MSRSSIAACSKKHYPSRLVAQTKKKRQTKHRGNAAGVVQARGRTGRPPTAEEKKRQQRELSRQQRLSRKPSWKTSLRNSAIMAVILFVIVLFTNKRGGAVAPALVIAAFAFVVYVPLGYYMEQFMWKRRMRNSSSSDSRRSR
jgi:Flp pilus assembly protein TadB